MCNKDGNWYEINILSLMPFNNEKKNIMFDKNGSLKVICS